MITFLFWNIKRKSLQANIARLVARHNVNMIALAECELTIEAMQDALYQHTGRGFYSPFSTCEKIAIYTDLPSQFLPLPLRESDRLTVRQLLLPGVPELLIAAAHLPSKLHWQPESQAIECVTVAELIREAESVAGHSRTLLVGDLNMNPFEAGLVSAAGLHGVMTRQIAEKQRRTVQGREYPFFYNPMWSRFGDLTEGPAGTYYDARAEQVNYFWNMFDQVLLRPDLLPYFRSDNLRILTDDGETSFVSANELPDDNVASDHLPILISLNI